MQLKILFKILIFSLIKSISFGSIYALHPYIHNIYINTLYIDKLNILLISLLLIKFYISYINFINTFKLLENIYSSTKYVLTMYTILINCDFTDGDIDGDIDDNDNSINISINTDNIQYNKKIQITYIKDLIILYLSISFSSIFKLNNTLISYSGNKQLLDSLNNEIKQINNSNNNTSLLLSLIELLILKNFNDLKNLNFINISDYNLLINIFKKLQDLISELTHINSANNTNNLLISFTYAVLYLNIIIIYIQYLNNDIFSFLCTVFINFIIIFIDDMINTYLNICKILSNIFDFENYIKEINEDIFMIHYLYISNKEYIL